MCFLTRGGFFAESSEGAGDVSLVLVVFLFSCFITSVGEMSALGEVSSVGSFFMSKIGEVCLFDCLFDAEFDAELDAELDASFDTVNDVAASVLIFWSILSDSFSLQAHDT